MRRRGTRAAGAALLGAAGLVFGAAPAARAVDHDNIDASRPLTFDDAETIAFRERAFEYGIAPTWPYRRRSLGLGLSAEVLYGYALNSHVSLDFNPSLGARSGSGDRGFDLGDVGVGIQRNLNRETLSRPAFGLRADAYLPTGRDSRGVGFRFRGIMSRTFNQYSRFHVNLDANVQTSPEEGERSFAPALTLGYSRPLGYPRRFDRTVVAELGARASDEENRGAVFYTGVGLRQQVTVVSVVDVGIRSDFAATNAGASRNNLQLVAGYSTQF